MVVKQEKVGILNEIFVEIEQDFCENYSIVAYDDANTVWFEEFATTKKQADKIADRLYKKVYRLTAEEF